MSSIVIVVMVVMVGIKWSILVNLSTHKEIALYPCLVGVRLTMKSMFTNSHFHSCICKGCNNPLGLVVGVFTMLKNITSIHISLTSIPHFLPLKTSSNLLERLRDTTIQQIVMVIDNAIFYGSQIRYVKYYNSIIMPPKAILENWFWNIIQIHEPWIMHIML